MKQLFEQIQKSIYDPQFYRTLLTKPFTDTWMYFSGYAMLLSLVLTITLSISLVSMISGGLYAAPDKVISYFPSDLIVTITKGHVNTNQGEPYVLPMPAEFGTTTVANLIVIDTKNPVTLDAFHAQHAMMLVGEHEVMYIGDNNGQIKINKIDPNLTTTIDRPHVVEWVNAARPYIKYVTPIMVLALFIGLLIYFGFQFIYMLFGALLIFVLGRIALKQNWSYGESYQIGLHALTLPLLLKTILMLLPIGIPSIPFFYSFILLVMVYVNFKDTKPLVPVVPNIPPEAPGA